MSEEEETKTSDGEKWRIQRLFKEFFLETPLSKGHLEVIEQNYKQELHDSIEDFERDFSEEVDKCNKTIIDLNKKIDAQEEKFKRINSTLVKVRSFIKIAKWVLGSIGASVIGILVTEVVKRW